MYVFSCQHFSPSTLRCPPQVGSTQEATAERAQPPPLVVTATEETSAFNCQVPHLLPVGGSGSLVLALVTFACLFSGVLGTPGRLDRGVMKGNLLPLPILFSLL